MDNFSVVRSQVSRGDIIKILLRVSIVSIITFYSVKWMMGQLDPTNKNKKKAKALAEIRLKRLSGEGYKFNVNQFNEYELMIASHIVVPKDIIEGWENIAGLDKAIQELKDSVVFPVANSDRFKHSKLWHPPKGVLLHGPPGCGKTLIAKATAKEAGMLFINLDVSILTDKWYGESQKLATAVFSLARKIAPCIIFIDEIDSFLRNRNSTDHEATAMMKTQFMMLWDGLNTNNNANVIVMGATNRPQDLDKAILRRMPAQIYIGLPDIEQRYQILKLILQDENVNECVDLRELAKMTVGFSGSDLKEMCRGASVFCVRNYMRLEREKCNSTNTDANALDSKASFQIELGDLVQSFDKIKLSKTQTGQMHGDNRIDLD